KMLPTFKGLLMAITSPETRFNCLENDNPNKINYISSNDHKIPLVNGLNVVIGENGSGKSTILSLISDKTNDDHIKNIIDINKLKVNGQAKSHRIKYISQGQIVESYFKSKLFSSNENDSYVEVDHSKFRSSYSQYFDVLTSIIESAIEKQEAIDNLGNFTIQYEPGMDEQTYYIQVEDNINTNSGENRHDKKLKQVKKVYDEVSKWKLDKYYSEHVNLIDAILNELAIIHSKIRADYLQVDHNEIVKNTIHSCVNKYANDIKEKSSASDRSRQNYNKKANECKQAVVNAICSAKKDMSLLEEPSVCNGTSTKLKNGFNFHRKAKYSEVKVLDIFLETIFVKDYASINKLSRITSRSEYIKAIRECTKEEDIKSKLNKNLSNFFENMTLCDEFITDMQKQKVGNTLGEQSLTFYKYFTQEKHNWDVLIIDQPEDNISNNNISNELIKYFNSIRNEKQIIFATHNPLLVVNMDVDNVIFMENNNGVLSCINGCLEYENDYYSLLDIVANNMDGGKESIEKRLKVYG
ncbi:MAG: ATP-binding protein, partial [Dysgonamonadaceae bacterium]|nr:ATP-binding protein [Dysgonamonadaceae bacterium]